MQEFKESLISNEIKRLVPVLGKKNAKRLGNAYLIGDEDTRKRIFELIDVLKAAISSDDNLNDTILMEPPEELVATEGNIELGTVLYGKKKMYPIKIDDNMLLTHVGIFGSSGYGKTNIAYNTIKTLSDKGIPVIIFDFSKRNYKDLLSTELKDRIDLFTIGRDVSPFKFNPLKPPPGISLSQWIKEFSVIFDHAYWLLGGGRHIIMKAFSSVLHKNQNPRMADLKEWVEEYGGAGLSARERNWLATAERPLESLCFREVGEVFDCDAGFNPADFFKKGRITILELDSLDTNDKTFFIEILLQWIRDMLLVNNQREKLQGVVILEEAHHVLNREKSKKIGSETVIDLIFREVRELGVGIVYIDQHPSLVSYPALGNTSTQIYMNLGLDTQHSSDVEDASRMLGLDEEEKYYLRKLPVGNGFILCRRLSFTNPFLVEFSKFDMEKGSITDADVRKVMKDKYSFDERPKEEVKKYEAVKEKMSDYSGDQIDESGWKILKTVMEGRGAFTSQIYKNIKMSGTVFSKKARKMLDMGMLSMANGKLNRNKMNYFFPTTMGMSVYETRFGRFEKTAEADINDIKYLFEASGWKLDEERQRLVFDKEGKLYEIKIQKNTSRNEINEAIKNCHYFLCANEHIKNIVLQEVSRNAQESRKGLTVFISTFKEFEKKNNFSRIEF